MGLFEMRSIEECTRIDTITDPSGIPYLEFSCIYPILQGTYMKWETNMPLIWPTLLRNYSFMLRNPITPFIAITLYGIMCIYGPRFFNNRKPWNFRNGLAAWNFFLSTFSFVGAMRLVPQVLFLLTNYPIRENICGDVGFFYSRGSSGFYVQMFVLSKFPELIDTFFIVVHKKPLIFLHWYHHVTVLLYCWNAYVTFVPAGPIFAAMNYSVHAVMYGYYFLMAMRMKPWWFKPIFITVIQIAQMVAGVIITMLNFYFSTFDPERTCNIGWQSLLSGFLMYGTYLYLFSQFFLKRYYVMGRDIKSKHYVKKFV